ncbi:hypothetical protein [Haloarchaeobius sp. DFWS5]|uniref:hypothetical protein n=1 Tax=Haloarchaeobius sp. DFWS5 TaxID=3446114 RepID=UPI003EBCE4F9
MSAEPTADDELPPGDPRVLFVMNLVLSALFSYAVLFGFDYIDLVAFSWLRLAGLTFVVMVVTYLAVLR